MAQVSRRSGSQTRDLMSTDGNPSAGLQDSGDYSVFTTRQPSRYVVACEGHPYTGHELNENFHKINDVKKLGQDSQQTRPLLFKFDAVHDESYAGRQE